MKLIMESWRRFLVENEEEAQSPKTRLQQVGAAIAKAWNSADDALRRDFCEKNLPQHLKNEGDIRTFGDLQALLKCTLDYVGKKKVLGLLTSALPWFGSAQSAFTQASDAAGFITKAYQTADSDRSKSNIGKLDMDDDVSKIVDNKIENAFIAFLIDKIVARPSLADTPIPADWNITKELQDWLQDKHNSRTVTGFRE